MALVIDFLCALMIVSGFGVASFFGTVLVLDIVECLK